MKKLIIISIIILANFSSLTKLSAQCDHEIDASVFVIDGDETTFSPGDVVCLAAGNKDFLLIRNVHGTSDNPITFINHGGAVIIDTDHFYGIKTAHSSFIKIMGDGVEGIDYGIQIKRVAQGSGVSIDELSTDIELGYIEIANTLIAGLYAKTDPDCSFTSSRDNFTMYNLSIHHCYIHDVGDEGLYIGHSKYEDGVHLDDCDTLIYPHLIKGVKVYNNILEHLGWDGIQVASADEDCSIYDNIIRYDSEKETLWQMSGILIGGGSRCDCYNNQIFDGKGDGIDVLGLGDFKVFNNLIVRAGKDFEPGNPNSTKHGIYVGDVVTIPNTEFGLYNNTIISPKSYGITYNNFVASKAKIYNNLIVDPGKKFEGDKGFINNLTTPGRVDLLNNIFFDEISQVGFGNPNGDDFDLKEGSVSIDFGKNLSSEGVTFDILNRNRPYNTFFDVGAFEWQGPDGINEGMIDIIKLSNIYPNPADNLINFTINLRNSQLLDCRLTTINGQQVLNYKVYCEANSNINVHIDINNINSGLYILEIITQNGSVHRKLIVK